MAVLNDSIEPFDAGTKAAVVVTRGGIVESEHFVRYALAGADGAIAASSGDIDGPVFMRSAAKPLIVAAVIASGAAERFKLSDEELAVAAGSHSGEPYHIAAVRSLLAKIGLDEGALQCGPHPPVHEPSARALTAHGHEPGRIHNNCSGKHAAILALARQLGAAPEGYLSPSHPSQVAILRAYEELLGVKPAAIGVDGCGIPVIAVPLREAAICFARFSQTDRFPARLRGPMRRVIRAMLAHPEHVGGTGRFDTDLMKAADGEILAKGGAEGYHASAWLHSGLGMAIKVADGNYRAVPPFVIERMAQHRALAGEQLERLARHRRPKVRNYAGTVVGEIVALSEP